MKTTRIAGIALLITLCVSPPLASQEQGDEPYYASMIRAWVEEGPEEAAGTSYIYKTIYRMGDQIALGIAHGFTRKELEEPSRLEHMLSLVKMSFDRPKYITRPQDRNPAVTVLLLSFLEHAQQDPKRKEQVRAAESYIDAQLKTFKCRTELIR